jgi:hypothetical protein
MSGRHRWLVALTALAAVVGVGGFVAFSRPSSVAPSPSSSIEARTAADFLWTYTEPLLPAGGGPPRSYTLQGGTLADQAPALDVEVPWVIGDRPADAARNPAVGGPVAGAVVYVADDGLRSTVHRVPLTPPLDDAPILVVDDVVWAVAATPDGAAAYLVVLDRESGADRGVVGLALDGSAALTHILDPAGVLVGSAGVRPAATAAQFSLAVAVDGSHLVRRACARDGTCVLDVVDLATLRATRLADREVIGLGAGYLLSWDCAAADCASSATDLSTGVEIPLTGIGDDLFLVRAGARAIVVHSEFGPDGNPHAILATDLDSGETTRLIESEGPDEFVRADNPTARIDLKLEAPDGWLIMERFADASASTWGVPVRGGAGIPLGAPPFRPSAEPGTQG